MRSPQPQVLSVHPTPRGEAQVVQAPSLASPPPRSPHHHRDPVTSVGLGGGGAPLSPVTPPPPPPALSPPAAVGGGHTTAHHVWTVGTSKRNTKSALRTSALARHQQALQERRGNVLDSGGGDVGGDLFPTAVLDQQLHYGVAGYRSDHGGVSFYRTSVHKKDPQNVVLSHGVMSRVVDLRSSPGKATTSHVRTLSGGSDGGLGGPSAAPMLGRYQGGRGEHHAHYNPPVHASLDDAMATQSLDGERVSFAGSANGIGPSPPRPSAAVPAPSGGGGGSHSSGNKPRWNPSSSSKSHRTAMAGGTPPPPTAASPEGPARSSPSSRRRTPPHQGPQGSRVRGASPHNAIRSALAGNRDGGSVGGSGRPSSVGRGAPSPPRRVVAASSGHNASYQAAHPSYGGGTPMGHVSISNHSGRQGHQALLPSGRASSTSHTAAAHSGGGGGGSHNATSGSHRQLHQHDCRDAHCLHSRGNIMEVIAAKSQVRAMESQLLHEEIRREQLATALSSERERSQHLCDSLAKAEASIQNSQIQLHDSEHWYEAYELRDKEARSFEERMLEAQATLAVERSANKDLRATVEQHEHTIDAQRKETKELMATVQRLSSEVSELKNVISNQQQHRQTTDDGAINSYSRGSAMMRRGSVEDGALTRSQWGGGSAGDGSAGMRERLSVLEADLARAAEERQSDERLRRELLRALADKEKQLASLLPSAGGSSNSLKSGARSTLSTSPPPDAFAAAGRDDHTTTRRSSGQQRQLLQPQPRGVPPSLVSASSGRRNFIHASSTTSEVRRHEVTSSTSTTTTTTQQQRHAAATQEASSTVVVSADDSLLELNVTALSADTAAAAGENDDADETPPPRLNVTHRLFDVDERREADVREPDADAQAR